MDAFLNLFNIITNLFDCHAQRAPNTIRSSYSPPSSFGIQFAGPVPKSSLPSTDRPTTAPVLRPSYTSLTSRIECTFRSPSPSSTSRHYHTAVAALAGCRWRQRVEMTEKDLSALRFPFMWLLVVPPHSLPRPSPVPGRIAKNIF